MKILAVIIPLVSINTKECQGRVINLRNRDNLLLRDDPVRNLYLLADEFIRHTLASCDLLLTADRFSPILSFQNKKIRATAITEMNYLGDPARQHSTSLAACREVTSDNFQEVWKESKAKCRAIVVDNINRNTTLINEFLSRSRMWLQPETRLLVLGNIQDLDALLNYCALRNTLHVVYIALHVNEDGCSDVKTYQRCLYCNRGRAGVLRLEHWSMDSEVPENQELFAEHSGGFGGYRFKVVELEYFPYITYKRPKGTPGALLLTDSLSTRMITVLAPHLNFTYEIMEPEDCQWGLEAAGGNWTGIIGTLQHEKADFSMDITVTTQRAAVVDFCKVHMDEDMVILSSKPRPPPEYLSLIKPFEGIVWLMVILCIMVWGTMLWLLLRARNQVLIGTRIDVASSLFYSWGLLLEDQPFEPPANLTGQVLVGIWLITCLILRALYMSSLISRLVEAGESSVINSIEEMVGRRETDGWEWGTLTMSGALNSLYTTSTNPDFHIAKQYMQTMGPEEGMQKVLEGDFSYIHNYYVMRILMATRRHGAATIPFHISNTKYPLFHGTAWACRPGSPFISRFNKAMQRLLDAGLVNFWMEDVIFTHVAKRRMQEKESYREINFHDANKRNQVVLGLLHLQVTFYLLLIGHTTATFAFLAEHILPRQ